MGHFPPKESHPKLLWGGIGKPSQWREPGLERPLPKEEGVHFPPCTVIITGSCIHAHNSYTLVSPWNQSARPLSPWAVAGDAVRSSTGPQAPWWHTSLRMQRDTCVTLKEREPEAWPGLLSHWTEARGQVLYFRFFTHSQERPAFEASMHKGDSDSREGSLSSLLPGTGSPSGSLLPTPDCSHYYQCLNWRMYWLMGGVRIFESDANVLSIHTGSQCRHALLPAIWAARGEPAGREQCCSSYFRWASWDSPLGSHHGRCLINQQT